VRNAAMDTDDMAAADGFDAVESHVRDMTDMVPV
jgi:hypothetical protein